jgi:hypothetical protein
MGATLRSLPFQLEFSRKICYTSFFLRPCLFVDCTRTRISFSPSLAFPNLTKLWWCQAMRHFSSEQAVPLHLKQSLWSPDTLSSASSINFVTTIASFDGGGRTMLLHRLLSYDIVSSTPGIPRWLTGCSEDLRTMGSILGASDSIMLANSNTGPVKHPRLHGRPSASHVSERPLR